MLCIDCHVEADEGLGKRGHGVRDRDHLSTEQVVGRLVDHGKSPDLVHVVGCPGAGKSTLCRQLEDHLSGWTHLELDYFRRAIKSPEQESPEDRALEAFISEIHLTTQAIVESSGLNNHLNTTLNHLNKGGRPMRVLLVEAPWPVCEERLRKSPEPPLWGDVDRLIRWSVVARDRIAALYQWAPLVDGTDPDAWRAALDLIR